METDPINMRIKLILIIIVLLLSLNLQIQAEEELPEIIGEHYRHGLQYFKKDQYPQAIQKFQAVLNQHPHFFPANYYLAEIYQAQGLPAKAIPYYQKVIESPTAFGTLTERSEIHYQLASAYRLLEQYDEAIDQYQNAIDLNSHHSAAYQDLGVTYSQQKQYKLAVKTFQQAIAVLPTSAMPHYNLGLIY